MDRSKQVSEVVTKSMELLKKRDDESFARLMATDCLKSQFAELRTQLRETVALLCSSQDYTDHLELDLANDLAHLSNEIVHDIVETASAYEWDLKVLAMLESPWAQFGKLAMEEDKFRDSEIHKYSNPNYLKATAFKFYEKIKFTSIPDNLCEILELMGTRFSKITWSDVPLQTCKRSAFASSQVRSFIKRQLKSKYLRTLSIICTKVETADMNDQFVDFVKRPQFESLYSQTPLPFAVFDEAHKAWEATTLFQVRGKAIDASVDKETCQTITKHFNVDLGSFDNPETCFEHPIHSTLQMRLFVRFHIYALPEYSMKLDGFQEEK